MINEEKERELFFILFFAESAEKIVRLECFIDEAKKEAPEKNLGVLQMFDETIEILKSQFLNEAHEFNERLESKGFSKDRKYSHGLILRLFNRFPRKIQEIHKCLKWIYTPWTEKETYAFLNQLVLGSDIKFSIVFTDEYTFLKHDTHKDLPDFVDISKAPLLALPKIERNNPLRRTILAHEVGHVLAERLNITTRIYENFSTCENFKRVVGEIKKDRILQAWIPELAADAISLRLLGPAAIMPFINFCITMIENNLQNPTELHPPPSRRLEYLLNSLEMDMQVEYQAPRFKESFEQFNRYRDFFSIRCYIDGEMRIDRIIDEDFEKEYLSLKLLKAIAENVYSLCWSKDCQISTFLIDDYDKNDELKKMLHQNIPIGSYSPERKKTSARSRLENAKENKKVNLAKIYPDLNQELLSMSEIVNAGWAEKLDRQLYDWWEIFKEAKEFEKAFNEYRDRLLEYDLLLRKSMEMSLIHTFYHEESKESGVK